jgi:hypothetical protein
MIVLSSILKMTMFVSLRQSVYEKKFYNIEECVCTGILLVVIYSIFSSHSSTIKTMNQYLIIYLSLFPQILYALLFHNKVDTTQPLLNQPLSVGLLNVHVPPCTAELSLQTRGKAFFLLYVEGGGSSFKGTV